MLSSRWCFRQLLHGILYPDGCITHKLLLRTELSTPVYRESPGWILFFHSFCLQWVLLSLFRSKKDLRKGILSYDWYMKRGVQLTFFAIFIQHFYPHVLSNPQDVRAWLLSILCFIILFPMFIRIPLKMPDWMRTVIKVTAYVIAIVLLLTTQYANERTFDVSFSNIIILLLANMAVFGSVIYIFTMQNLRARIGILLILMALLLS